MNSPIDRSVLLLHLEYSAWATALLLKAAAGISSEEVTGDRGASHGGILDTLRHIFYADRIWLARLTGGQQAFKDPGPEPSLGDLQQAWPELLARFRQHVDLIPEADFSANLHYTNLKGEALGFPRWQVLLHVVNHATLHRGQVVAMLRQMGYQPPATDLIYFYQQSLLQN